LKPASLWFFTSLLIFFYRLIFLIELTIFFHDEPLNSVHFLSIIYLKIIKDSCERLKWGENLHHLLTYWRKNLCAVSGETDWFVLI
jgi:hypothetical protein